MHFEAKRVAKRQIMVLVTAVVICQNNRPLRTFLVQKAIGHFMVKSEKRVHPSEITHY
jgi:hypothetical protein